MAEGDAIESASIAASEKDKEVLIILTLCLTLHILDAMLYLPNSLMDTKL